MGHDDHKKQADDSIGCVIITCSDTRTEDTDESGKLIRELLTEAGHKVAGYVEAQPLNQPTATMPLSEEYFRRVEAIAGTVALAHARRQSEALERVAGALKAQPLEVEAKIAQILESVKALEKEVARLKGQLAFGRLDERCYPIWPRPR